MGEPARLVAVVGPTASGKTALACALAERLDAEIISADSQQCYRGLDAGTAKPTREEQARARHHLLDVADPETQLDAAAFIALAEAAIQDLTARRKTVLVVGGTGLWIRALISGLVDAPGADPGFRAAFRADVQALGLPALHARLAKVDPEAARTIRPEDRVRIERALEVHHQSGRPLSELQREHRASPRRHRARFVLLDPPREELWQRIARRTHAFFTPGPLAEGPLLAETRLLLARIEQVPAAAKALRIIGYGEAAEAIARGCDAESLRAAEEAVLARTRQYAKRQRTWFKKDAVALDETGAPLRWPPGLPAAGDLDLDALAQGLREWLGAS